MRIRSLTLVLLAAALALPLLAAAPAPAPAPAAAGNPKIGAEPPAFTLKDAAGKDVSLADYKGKIVVLEWINYECPIDRRVIDAKYISTVYDKFRDKIVWLAIDSAAAHKKPDYDKTISECKLAYPLLTDPTGKTGHAYNATNTPQMFIINTDGKLVYNGAIDDDPNGTKSTRINYVEKALTELLAGKPVSLAETKPYGCTVKY